MLNEFIYESLYVCIHVFMYEACILNESLYETL